MKKILFSLALMFASGAAHAQFTLIDENFDSYSDFVITGFGQWQTLDLDMLPTYTGGSATTPTWDNAGDPMAFQIFNPSAAGVTNNAVAIPTDNETRNFDPRSGTKYAAAWGAVPSTTGGAIANNDWLISPAITLGLTGNTLSFWVKALSSTYGPERFRVGVYVGSGTPTSAANFTIISGLTPLSATYPNWTEYTAALNTYAGQTVRIGIQCVSADVYMFMVDDFKITALTLGTNESAAAGAGISVYPNPTADYLRVDSKVRILNTYLYDLSGIRMDTKIVDGKIDVRSLPVGNYILGLKTEEGMVSKKFIKK